MIMRSTSVNFKIDFDKLTRIELLKSKVDARVRHLLSQCDLVLDDEFLDVYVPTKLLDYYLSHRIIYLDNKVSSVLSLKVRLISSNGMFWV